jgi:hypothetical protein
LERSCEHDAFGMRWPEARMQTEDGVELLDQILSQS